MRTRTAALGVTLGAVLAAVGLKIWRRRAVPGYSAPVANSPAVASALVDEAGLDSFPASDPPGWTLGEDPKS